jgi:hypothetical protein
MQTPVHYNQFSPKFEPYKILNNTTLSSNLCQSLQYIFRRKHKGHEKEDIGKAFDFFMFELDRIHTHFHALKEGRHITRPYIIEIYDKVLHQEFLHYITEKDLTGARYYNTLTYWTESKHGQLYSVRRTLAEIEANGREVFIEKLSL